MAPDLSHRLRHLDLFSGIGGFSLGLERTGGFETVAFCENNPDRIKWLQTQWPGVPIIEDIRDVPGADIGPVDIVTGGFPCQPFSAAGRRRGTADDRYLWPEMLAVIDACRPAWIIAENVAGLGTMVLDRDEPVVESRNVTRHPDQDHFDSLLAQQETMLLNAICDDLCSVGYEVAPLVIPACAVDAPHIRERLWIVAYATGDGREDGGAEQRLHGAVPDSAERARGSDMAQPESEPLGTTGQPRQRRHVGDTAPQRREQAGADSRRSPERPAGAGDMEYAAGIGRGEGKPEPEFRGGRSAVAKPGGTGVTLANTERIRQPGQGAPRDNTSGSTKGGDRQANRPVDDCAPWADAEWIDCADGKRRRVPRAESRICPLDHGLPGRVAEIEGYGNAIVPEIVTRIGCAILEAA